MSYFLGLGELSPRLSHGWYADYPESQSCHIQNNGHGRYFYGYHDQYGQWLDCVPFSSFELGIAILIATVFVLAFGHLLPWNRNRNTEE